jgi:predicted phage terminase large subunit-like protein
MESEMPPIDQVFRTVQFHSRRAGEALHPEWESVESLRRLEREVGSPVFAAQYQQSPVPPGGGMIQRNWLYFYDQLPKENNSTRIIQSWDTAAKDGIRNDYSVCTTWMVIDRRLFYLMNVARGHYDYPTLKRSAIALAERYNPEFVLIEDASTGTALGQDLQELHKKHFRLSIRLVPIERDKIARLFVHQAKFERGEVLFPRNADFLPTLFAELLTFPQSRYDDQVDSLSQALSFNIGFDTTYKWS